MWQKVVPLGKPLKSSWAMSCWEEAVSSSSFWSIYLKYPVSLDLRILSLVLVNYPQAL